MMPTIDALLFVFVTALALGSVIVAITLYAFRGRRHMLSEIAKLESEIRDVDERGDRRVREARQECDERMEFHEALIKQQGQDLVDLASAFGRNDLARTFADRSGVTINAGEDVNVGGDVSGRDKRD